MSARQKWAITALFALLPLLGWWATGLFDLDEGFYAAVTSEMNRRGEWITPYYNGHTWFEKPILLYWLAKPCLAAFGEMVGPRLPSVLANLATYWLIGAYMAKCRDLNQGILSVGILASSLIPILYGRLMMTDAPLMLAMAGAYLSFWESLNGNPRFRLITAFCLGVGVLAKGPVACLLFVPVAAWVYWKQPDLRPAFRGGWLAGTAILVAVVATWYLPAYLANGQTFVQEFLIEQNLNRFTGGDKAHSLGLAGLPIYIPVVLIGMLPWSIWGARLWLKPDGDPFVRYLSTWATVIFVFFSLSGAKLPHYILPMFPALAMLAAIRLKDRTWAWPTALGLCMAMSAFMNVGIAWWYAAGGQEEAHQIAHFVRAQGGPVSLYQMPRRNKALGTGQLTIQQTSLPSMLLYLNSTAQEAETLDELDSNPGWVITRMGRIKPEDFATLEGHGRHLVQVPVLGTGVNYAVYRLE